MTDTLLPNAVEVSFSEIESALADAGQVSLRGRPSPALTATVVVVGPHDRLADAADALELMTDAGGVRTMLISNDGESAPSIRVSHQAIALQGLKPEYVDNAVAALRLSSLPTMVWWRGGESSRLEDLTSLADRLVLDAEDPTAAWAIMPALTVQAAISDIRWTRLTSFRCLMANFFDIPAVRAAAPAFQRLEIAAFDRHAGRLFAGWLTSSLRWNGTVAVTPGQNPRSVIEHVRFGDDAQAVTLAVRGDVVEAVADVAGHSKVSRTVPLGDNGLRSLISEELRIRSRDLPFERALRAAEGLA